MAATNWLLLEPARNESAHAISEDPGAMSVAGATPWLLGLATAILVAGAVFAHVRVKRLNKGWNANFESRVSELRVKAQEIFNSE